MVRKNSKAFGSKTHFRIYRRCHDFLGYLAYVRVSASIPADLASVQALVGAAVFPIGLIVILMAGGELITGNMMAVSTAWFAKKVSFRELLVNWVTITLANMVGALFVAYFWPLFRFNQ